MKYIKILKYWNIEIQIEIQASPATWEMALEFQREAFRGFCKRAFQSESLGQIIGPTQTSCVRKRISIRQN